MVEFPSPTLWTIKIIPQIYIAFDYPHDPMDPVFSEKNCQGTYTSWTHMKCVKELTLHERTHIHEPLYGYIVTFVCDFFPGTSRQSVPTFCQKWQLLDICPTQLDQSSSATGMSLEHLTRDSGGNKWEGPITEVSSTCSFIWKKLTGFRDSKIQNIHINLHISFC